MVTIISMIQITKTISKRTPLVVELVGPAGAGKTTIAQSLRLQSERIEAIDPPSVRRVIDTPFFLTQIVFLLPIILRINMNSDRWLTRREIAWMAILNGWHRLLQKRVVDDGNILIIDQGPVFLMAQLFCHETGYLRNRGIEKWRDFVYGKCAKTLDMVIFLNASNQDLLERIRSREKLHMVKGDTDLEIFEYLENERLNLGHEIAMLEPNEYSPELIRFDTTLESIDDIVSKILVEFSLKSSVDGVNY